jgi:hypothetical protein
VIEQTARRRDDHVNATAKGVLLRPHPDASIDGRAAERRVNGQRVQVLGDLRRQLTCRREYERTRRPTRFVDEPAENRQQKRGRLAAARLRAGKQVAASKRRRHRFGLDRCRPSEAELAMPFRRSVWRPNVEKGIHPS